VHRLKELRLGWPQVAVIAIVALVFISSYWMPDDIRAEIRADVGWAWGALATFLGPIVKRKLQEEMRRDDLATSEKT